MNDECYLLPHVEPAQVEALAEQLERDTGCTIDRVAFADDLEVATISFANARYFAGPNPVWDAKVTEAKSAFKAALESCRRFRLALERAHLAHLEHTDEMKRAFVAPWEKLVEISSPPFAVDFETMLHDVRDIEDKLEKPVEMFRAPRGRPRNWAWHGLVVILGHAYHGATGQRPTTSTIRGSDDRGGPFVRFVVSFLDNVDPGGSRAGLGNHIQSALQQLRRANSPLRMAKPLR